MKAFDEIETEWIPLRDGRRLAARLMIPKRALGSPVPVILEYIPYRRRDGTRLGDNRMHRWFAANGYASARVDIAGSGDSDGITQDEYAPREQEDGLDVIAWLSAQPWCSGAVGMIGISWGGFNGLQIAARRPKALKAVISLCSTVDRYADDVHYMGGCLLNCNLDWGAYFFTMSGLPPDPDTAGADRWRALWKERIEAVPLYPARWVAHQRRDDYWRHGSVCENFAAIKVPVLAVSGWADGYTNAVFELVANLCSPCKGIIGPWGHRYPMDGVPGPAIGFLREAKRWWDRWLKGKDTGVEHDPALRLWLQEPHRPAPHIPERPGRWIAFPRWPSPKTGEQSLWLRAGQLTHRRSPAGRTRSICSPLTTGLSSGEWCAYGLGKIAPELPLDQRPDDAGSLAYDGEMLDQALVLAGRPVVHLKVSSDKPRALIAVRLCAVHADGQVERLSYGVLNLCHRHGPDRPALLQPGQADDVTVTLKPLAHRVAAGQRLRLSISTSYWPLFWPSPEAATVTVHDADSWLTLPVIADAASLTGWSFETPEPAPAPGVTIQNEGAERRVVMRDIGSGETIFSVSRDDGRYVIDEIGTAQTFTKLEESRITDGDPLSAGISIAYAASYTRGAWTVRIKSEVTMTADAENFHFTARLAAYDGESLFAERTLRKSVAREFL